MRSAQGTTFLPYSQVKAKNSWDAYESAAVISETAA